MSIPYWEPPERLSKQEELLLHQVRRTRKLFGFLRLHRHELFDRAFQDELAGMYRGSGKPALPPALLAMATLLQGYLGISDAEAVQLSVVDLRWQMVLGCLGASQPPFSQGALHDFRTRLIRTKMDRRLLERTVELAMTTGAFDWKKLPKSLDVAIDSSPLEGCGRVEDLFNLLAHAGRSLIACSARLLERSPKTVAREAGFPWASASSVKAALDIDWADEAAKLDGLNELAEQTMSLLRWVDQRLGAEAGHPLMKERIKTLRVIHDQNLEPSTVEGRKHQPIDGVAKDRRISVTDADMRHGRKNKTRRVDGFKRHIAMDRKSKLIVACALTPANLPEGEGGELLKADIDQQGMSLDALHIDRAYMSSSIVDDVLLSNGDVFCKPWIARNGQLFSKGDFKIDLEQMTISCPAGATQRIERGTTAHFSPEDCDNCEMRARCTTAAKGRGRGVRIAPDEDLQQQFHERLLSTKGRAKLRERVVVEHGLAHIGARQGPRARYRGTRRNLFDLRRVAAIQNLETIHRWQLDQKVAA